MIELSDIGDLTGCRDVVALQQEVWGLAGEIVPASVLIVSVKRGGILIGAYDADDLVGFVWSFPGWRDGTPTQWSHMLAVRPQARRTGTGLRLKIAQRERALRTSAELVEWTFDPLQAANAHLNLNALGCVAVEYRADAYGAVSGPLTAGTPTDRLVAEWRIREPHVERRLAARMSRALVARDRSVLDAPAVLETHQSGEWVQPGEPVEPDARRVLVPVPPRYTEMQQHDTASALAWRHVTRRIFRSYFSRGYRAVDFFLDRESGGGRYLLARGDDDPAGGGSERVGGAERSGALGPPRATP